MGARTRLLMRIVAVLTGCALVTAACGGGDDGGSGEEAATPSSGAIEEEGQPPATPTGVLRMSSTLYPLSLDPQRDTNFKGVWFYPMYDSLTMQDDKGEPQPWLATSWERPDPLTWRFKLRTDVTFHDGSTFDATVVKKNLDRTKADKASPHAAVVAPISEVVVVDPVHRRREVQDALAGLPRRDVEQPRDDGVGPGHRFGCRPHPGPAGSGGWILDASKSVPQQSETYNANPNYWNKDVVHVQQIVITHINDINARHNAPGVGPDRHRRRRRHRPEEGPRGQGLQVRSSSR